MVPNLPDTWTQTSDSSLILPTPSLPIPNLTVSWAFLQNRCQSGIIVSSSSFIFVRSSEGNKIQIFPPRSTETLRPGQRVAWLRPPFFEHPGRVLCGPPFPCLLSRLQPPLSCIRTPLGMSGPQLAGCHCREVLPDHSIQSARPHSHFPSFSTASSCFVSS